MKKTLFVLTAVALLSCCLSACNKSKSDEKSCCHEKAACCEQEKDCCDVKKDCCEEKKDCCDDDQKKADSLGAGCCG